MRLLVSRGGYQSTVDVGDALVSTRSSPTQRQTQFKLPIEAVSPSPLMRSGRVARGPSLDEGHSLRAERVAILGLSLPSG